MKLKIKNYGNQYFCKTNLTDTALLFHFYDQTGPQIIRNRVSRSPQTMSYIIFSQSCAYIPNSITKFQQFLFIPGQDCICVRCYIKVKAKPIKTSAIFMINSLTSYDILSISSLQSLNRSAPSDLPPIRRLLCSITICI